MKKILTAVCAVIGIICGGLVNYFGHCNIMLLAFTIILILTYLTEWMKALYQKKKESRYRDQRNFENDYDDCSCRLFSCPSASASG